MSNQLKNEISPYLPQHAENPVVWYLWDEDTFRLAWESFEAPETAELLNCWLIAIKVGREERPDVDSVYMTVCQAFTGSGGRPTGVFLTPEKQPFFAERPSPRIAGAAWRVFVNC